MNVSYGNPSLDAEVSHSFDLGYSYFSPKLNFSVSASSSFINNAIERISKVGINGATLTTYQNIGNNERYGLNVYFNYKPTGKVSFYMNGGINYSKLEAFSDYAITNDGFSYRTYMGGRLTIWEGGTVSANGGMSSANISLQGKSSGYYSAGFGFSQYFFKRKLMMNIYANDPFWYKKSSISKNYDATFYSRSEYQYLAQTVRINLTYNFGKMDLKVKKASRSIQNDDLKNGGDSQGGAVQQ
jgi:outer membrane receptor protein involved in Fe transport